MLDEPLREPARVRTAHERDERPGDARERGGVERLHVVRGERGHRRRQPAMRHRDADRAGDGRERRHAGDDLERDIGVGERERLLPAAAEEERVAALEPDDEAVAAELDEKLVDLFLRQAVALDRDPVRLGDELGRNETVVDEHVRLAHVREPLHRDEARIARACADEGDAHPAGVGVDVERID